MYSQVPVIWSASAGPRGKQGVGCRSAPNRDDLGSRRERVARRSLCGAVTQAMATELLAPPQVEQELSERAAATTPSSMAAAVMLAALPQAHLLAPDAHGAAAAVVPLAFGRGLGLEPMRSRCAVAVCVCVCVCVFVCVCQKPGPREILVVQFSRRAVENSKVSRVQAATFQEGRDRMHTIGERQVQIPKTIEEKY